MLKQEDYIVIRTLKKRGVYTKDIAAELGVHPRTVSRALSAPVLANLMVEKEFSSDRHYSKLLEIYQELIRNRKSEDRRFVIAC